MIPAIIGAIGLALILASVLLTLMEGSGRVSRRIEDRWR